MHTIKAVLVATLRPGGRAARSEHTPDWANMRISALRWHATGGVRARRPSPFRVRGPRAPDADPEPATLARGPAAPPETETRPPMSTTPHHREHHPMRPTGARVKSPELLRRRVRRRPARATASSAPWGCSSWSASASAPIVGTGIFVGLSDTVAEAGPAVVVSFVLAAVTCVFTAFSFAELGGAIPVSGSSYSFAYASARRARRLPRRLVPAAGVRRLGLGGGRRLGPVPQRTAAQPRRAAAARRRSPPRPATAAWSTSRPSS